MGDGAEGVLRRGCKPSYYIQAKVKPGVPPCVSGAYKNLTRAANTVKTHDLDCTKFGQWLSGRPSTVHDQKN